MIDSVKAAWQVRPHKFLWNRGGASYDQSGSEPPGVEINELSILLIKIVN